MTSEIAIVPAESPDLLAEARALILEYADSLGIDLSFQGFDREVAGLPGGYAPPDGRLLLALAGPVHQPVGCAALRRLDDTTGEVKRLYVRPAGRGLGVGRALAEQVVAEARAVGYRRLLLDTLPTMAQAIGLYRSLGFREVPAYRHNPVPGALFLELALD